MADKHIRIWEIRCIEAFIATPQWTWEKTSSYIIKFVGLLNLSMRYFVTDKSMHITGGAVVPGP
jgi:hypothetical protein